MTQLTSGDQLRTLRMLVDTIGRLDVLDALGQLRLSEIQVGQLRRTLLRDAVDAGIDEAEIRSALGWDSTTVSVSDTSDRSASEPSRLSDIWEDFGAVPSLLDLAFMLRETVFGQDAAVGAVAERVPASFQGLKLRPERPHSVILLNGPSGTGKTSLARQLAVAAFGDADAMIHLDMTEYRDAADAMIVAKKRI